MFRFIILRVLGGLLQARNQKLFRAGEFSVFLELGNFNKQPPAACERMAQQGKWPRFFRFGTL